MTDEKMAEQFASCGYALGCTKTPFESAKDGFLAGLKAGRPKWHKVADGDLPPIGRRFLVSNEYCAMIGYWNGKTFVSADEEPTEIASPIAWCEIPKYTEE